MKKGKTICNTLKQIRLDVARANGIEYTPVPCDHEGECSGTCPACEREVRFLENEIARKRSLGKAALIAGVSLGMTGLSALAGNGGTRINSMPSEHGVQSQVCDTTKTQAEVFGVVEQMPSFPGGETALMNFIKDNLVYPPEAAKNKIQGRVVVQFVVDKTGTVGEIKVVRPVHDDLDREAVRVCRLLPKFSPARQNGKAIDVWYTLPFSFKLQDTPVETE